jgi:hypothetical protein
MHDIKFFFSIKIIRQSRRRHKKFQREQIIKNITEKYYFSKFRGTRAPDNIESAPVYFCRRCSNRQ